MKKTIFFILLAITSVVAADSTDTQQIPYAIMVAEANESTNPAISLSGSEGDFAHKPASAIDLKANGRSDMKQSALQVITCANGDGKTFTVTFYGWKSINGPAEVICQVAYTCGTQDVVKYPHNGATATAFWADTASITDYWDGAAIIDASGGNRIVKLIFDFRGYRYIYAAITNADGSTGIEADEIYIFYTYY